MWNPTVWACAIHKYLKLIPDNLVITCDEIIDAIARPYHDVSDAVAVTLNDKKATCKMDNYHSQFY